MKSFSFMRLGALICSILPCVTFASLATPAQAIAGLPGNAAFDQIWYKTGAMYNDRTNAANQTVYLGGSPASDGLYLGSQSPFGAVSFLVETWGAGGSLNYAYSVPVTNYNITGFSALTLTYNPSNDFKTSNASDITSVNFAPPSDWAKTTINGVSAYWVRISTKTTYNTLAKITQFKGLIYNYSNLVYDGDSTLWKTDLIPTLDTSCILSGGLYGWYNDGNGRYYYALRTDGGKCTLSFASSGHVTEKITLTGLTTTKQPVLISEGVVLSYLTTVAVVDERGNAIAGATVMLGGNAPYKTKSNGLYFFNKAGISNAQLSITQPGYVTEDGTGVNKAFTSVTGGSTATGTVILLFHPSTPCLASITPSTTQTLCQALQEDMAISVFKDGLVPLSGATVSVYSNPAMTQLANDLGRQGQMADAQDTTTVTGTMRFALDSGTYYYKATASGMADVTGSFTAISGKANTVSIAMAPPIATSVSASQSTVIASPAIVTADGVQSSTVTVTTKDANGALITKSSQVALSSSLGGVTISPASIMSDQGTATFTVKSSVVGSAQLTATVDGLVMTAHPTVQFISGSVPADTTVSAAQSTVVAVPSTIYGNGIQTSTITVVVKNAGGIALSGKTVALSSSLSGVSMSPSVAVSDASGVAVFSVKAAVVGSAQLTAVADGVILSSKPTLQLILQGVCGFAVGQLVKLPDDGNSKTQEDTAVYYYGKDCKRHAFPNSRVYFTWYPDFKGIVVVPASTLASMSLGKNISYRPGVKMVKFTTLNNVYVVGHGGLLRWVKTEGVATGLYGSTWNKQIDDVEDTFYGDYMFGADVNAMNDFSTAVELNNALTIDDNL